MNILRVAYPADLYTKTNGEPCSIAVDHFKHFPNEVWIYEKGEGELNLALHTEHNDVVFLRATNSGKANVLYCLNRNFACAGYADVGGYLGKLETIDSMEIKDSKIKRFLSAAVHEQWVERTSPTQFKWTAAGRAWLETRNYQQRPAVRI